MSRNGSWEDIRKAVKKELDEERYMHTLGVAYTAQALAMRWGGDLDKAYLAGLLHDCAKCIKRSDRLPLCEKWGIVLSEAELANSALLHAKMGEHLASAKYHVTDPEILSAIRFHTTGRPEMSLLEKIVFLADYVEPNRDRAPGLPELRRLVFTDIDRAVYEVAAATADYVSGTVSEGIDPMTVETRDYYLEVVRKRTAEEENTGNE